MMRADIAQQRERMVHVDVNLKKKAKQEYFTFSNISGNNYTMHFVFLHESLRTKILRMCTSQNIQSFR